MNVGLSSVAYCLALGNPFILRIPCIRMAFSAGGNGMDMEIKGEEKGCGCS
jgi:hypothetical protein